LTFDTDPSEALTGKLARVLAVDPDELLLLAEKIPVKVRVRVLQKPDAFRAFAACDDETIDKTLEELGNN
jgi:HTH-type transcriptional regulator, competence development regulator